MNQISVFGGKDAASCVESNLNEWFNYLNRLCDCIEKEYSHQDVLVAGGKQITRFQHKLVTILQTELYARTGRLVNVELLLGCERSTAGFYHRSKLAEAMQALEQYLNSGKREIDNSA